MNKDDFIDELVALDGESEIFVETDCNNYRIYDLSWEDEEYEEGTYKCNDLGNWYYINIEELAVALYEEIEGRNEKISSVDTE